MLGRLVNNYLNSINEPGGIWGDALNDLHQSDGIFVNLECVLTKSRKRGPKENPTFFFKADPKHVAVLKAAGVNHCSLANNHILDYGPQGLQDTLATLDKADIKHAGAGSNLTAATRGSDLETKGLKIRVFSFTDNEPGWQAKKTGAGTNYLPIDTRDGRYLSLLEKVDRAKNEGCLVVISAHWGPNMVRKPSRRHVDFARSLINSGVDIFYGHSAHVFQAVEVYKQKVIFYDTGQMIDDYAVDPILRNDESFLFEVRTDNRAIREVILKPVRIRIKLALNGPIPRKIQLEKLSGQEAGEVNRKMADLCRLFKTPLTKDGNNLRIGVL